MRGTTFEKDYSIHYYETGKDQKLNISSLLCFFEEMALLQSESKQVGLDYYTKHKIAWMLYQFDIRLHNPPQFLQNIKVVTQPSGFFRFFGYRNFHVFDNQNNELITAHSSWLFVNTENKRPTKIHDEITLAYGLPLNADTKEDFEPIPEFKECQYQKEFQVRYSDIDFNKHVNNVKYVEWAMEAIPVEVHEAYTLKRIQVMFKKENHYGMKITSQVQLETIENGLLCKHRILDKQDNESCILASYWEKD